MTADTRTLRTLTQEPEELLIYLGALSNSQFRRASMELGERILVETDEELFWKAFLTLFRNDRKAYLGTLLKALTARISDNDGSRDTASTKTNILWNENFTELCRELTDTDRKKILLSLLPTIPSPNLAERLLRQCGLAETSAWLPFLLQVKTAPCAFLLLKSMRYVEHDRALLIRTCHFLIKSGDALSFNLASLLRTSFGLEEVKGTFSLSLKPYQLSRIEQNYEAFLKAIRF